MENKKLLDSFFDIFNIMDKIAFVKIVGENKKLVKLSGNSLVITF